MPGARTGASCYVVRMTRVKVLYFAAVRDLVGRDEEDLELPADTRTIDALSRWLERERPTLAGRLGVVRFARNECFVKGDEALAEGDVVALIPPVAGG